MAEKSSQNGPDAQSVEKAELQKRINDLIVQTEKQAEIIENLKKVADGAPQQTVAGQQPTQTGPAGDVMAVLNLLKAFGGSGEQSDNAMTVFAKLGLKSMERDLEMAQHIREYVADRLIAVGIGARPPDIPRGRGIRHG